MKRLWIGLLLLGVISFGLLSCSPRTAEDRGGDAVQAEMDGDQLLKAGYVPAAIQKYQLAVHLAPDHLVAHRLLAFSYERAGDYGAAVSEFRLIIARYPAVLKAHPAINPAHGAYAHYWLSEALQHEGKEVEANAEAKLALQIAESDQKHDKKIARLAAALRAKLGN